MPMSSPTRRRRKMSRYAKPGQTIEDLKRMISDNGGVKETIYNDKLKVHKDLLKVDMGHDFAGLLSDTKLESAQGIPDYEMIGSGNGQFPVAWCYSHSDGEFPVAFVLYIGQEGKLRAYIPNDGNSICGSHSRQKEAYSHDDMGSGSEYDGGYWFKYGEMKNAVIGRISVKGETGSVKGGETPLTFRQVIQSLRDYGDKYASVMPVAKGAENSMWGIEDIWFEDGVLMLGQHDDEGLTTDLIADRIEGCVPSELLDSNARVKIGVTERPNGVMELYTKYGEPCAEHFVKSSVVKSCRDDYFCKWTIKFA